MPLDQIAELEESIGPKRAYALALKEKIARIEKRRMEEEKERLEDSLIEFHKAAWEHMDPAPYVHGRHLDAIAEHLEAVAYAEIRKLLVNVAPRHSKSLLVSVSFPAWLWAKKPDPEYPLIGAQLRMMCLSYGDTLSLDLALTHRRLIQSDWYQKRWGDRVKLCADQEAKSKFDTTAGGSRISASFQGGITGRGGLLKILDDPIKAGDEDSELTRQKVLDLYDGTLKSRITDPKTCAEIIVMQRLHQEDLSGHVLDDDEDLDADDPNRFVHLCLPEEFEEYRRCTTPIISYGSGRYYGEPWEDWREKDGELLWGERFGPREIAPFKRDAYQWAAQWQQRPTIKGGGILKYDYWQPWENKDFPECDFVLAVLDPAFTEKESNDPAGFAIFGTFVTEDGERGAILLHAFRKWLELCGPDMPRHPNETRAQYRLRCQDKWGIVETVDDLCTRFGVDQLLIENKASGLSIVQAMARLFTRPKYVIGTVDPRKLDKVARMIRVQAEFAAGQIYAPFEDGEPKSFAAMVMDECAVAPKGKYDDLLDAVTYAVYHLRSQGFLERRDEQFIRKEDAAKDWKQKPPLYRI
jgi:hypothetical protein